MPGGPHHRLLAHRAAVSAAEAAETKKKIGRILFLSNVAMLIFGVYLLFGSDALVLGIAYYLFYKEVTKRSA